MNVFVFICIGVEYLGTFCTVLFGFRKCNKINYIAHPLRIPGINVISTPDTSFYYFCSINTINRCERRIFQCFSMALKPKDVRVLLPVQLILDCHWLVCVRGEGLTDGSINGVIVITKRGTKRKSIILGVGYLTFQTHFESVGERLEAPGLHLFIIDEAKENNNANAKKGR